MLVFRGVEILNFGGFLGLRVLVIVFIILWIREDILNYSSDWFKVVVVIVRSGFEDIFLFKFFFLESGNNDGVDFLCC